MLVALEGHSGKATKFQYYVWNVYMNIWMHIYIYIKCVCNPIGLHIFVPTCVYVCVYTHTHTHTHTRARARARIWCAYNYICTHVHTYLWTLISNCWFQWPRGLKRGSAVACLLALWVRKPPGRGCLFLVSVVFSQVEVSASGWLLVHRSSAECGVSKCDRETLNGEYMARRRAEAPRERKRKKDQ